MQDMDNSILWPDPLPSLWPLELSHKGQELKCNQTKGDAQEHVTSSAVYNGFM